MPPADEAKAAEEGAKGGADEIPEIIKEAIKYCWSNGFLDVFRQYFKDNAKPFIGFPPKRDMEQAEHTLEHHDLYMKYLKLYEDTLEDWLKDKNVNLAEFHKSVQEVQLTSPDREVQNFVYCLLASCDYDSFYSVMVREAIKVEAEQKNKNAPEVAESKSPTGGEDDGGSAKGASSKGDK